MKTLTETVIYTQGFDFLSGINDRTSSHLPNY